MDVRTKIFRFGFVVHEHSNAVMSTITSFVVVVLFGVSLKWLLFYLVAIFIFIYSMCIYVLSRQPVTPKYKNKEEYNNIEVDSRAWILT